MCRNYSPKRFSLSEVLFYVLSMLILITGTACLVAAIDPRPLPKEHGMILAIIGAVFVIKGLLFLILFAKKKSSAGESTPSTQMSSMADCSSADLLNANFGSSITLESISTVNQCMMTQSPDPFANTVFWYKETVV